MTEPKKIPYTVKLDAPSLRELRRVQLVEGVPVSEQIRRAIRLWLAKKQKERKS